MDETWAPPPGSRQHRRLLNAQTQELEDLTFENSQLADQLQGLEEENQSLKKLVEKQADQLKVMEKEDKTQVVEDKNSKGKLSLLRDKVSMMQKKIQEDNMLSNLLSKEQKQCKTLEKQLEEAQVKSKCLEEEVAKLHEKMGSVELNVKRLELQNQELVEEIEELRAVKEAQQEAHSTQFEHHQELMMLLTPNTATPGLTPDTCTERFSFAGGQDLLSQLQMSEPEGLGLSARRPSQSDPEMAGDERLLELESMPLTVPLETQDMACQAQVQVQEQKVQVQTEVLEQQVQVGVQLVEKQVQVEEEKQPEKQVEALVPLEPLEPCTVKLLGTQPKGEPKAEDVKTDLSFRVAELEEELEKAQKMLRLWQEERDQSSWSRLMNGLMCTSRS